MGFVREYGPLVGRILIAAIFVVAGFNKITGFEGTVGYIASQNLPMPSVLAALTIVIELLGGAMIIVGFKARLAAIVIFLWLIPVTLVFHAFWSVPAEQMQVQQIMFLKNLAIMGAMLYVAAFGAGKYSIDKS